MALAPCSAFSFRRQRGNQVAKSEKVGLRESRTGCIHKGLLCQCPTAADLPQSHRIRRSAAAIRVRTIECNHRIQLLRFAGSKGDTATECAGFLRLPLRGSRTHRLNLMDFEGAVALRGIEQFVGERVKAAERRVADSDRITFGKIRERGEKTPSFILFELQIKSEQE